MEKLGIKCKEMMAKEIKERLEQNPNLFITSFSSIVVSDQEQLRRKLKEINASVVVVKNRIVKEVFQQLNLEVLSSLIQELTAITLGGNDAVCTSKTLVAFAGKHENFKILGAYVDKQLLDLGSVKRLASIPSKEVLLTQIACGLNSPIQGFVTSLSATIKKFVIAIDKIREKK